jgi:hypothetical protein
MKLSMEECFSRGECVVRPGMSVHSDRLMPSHASQMTFFCGHEAECDVFNGEVLFRKAVEVMNDI